MTELEVWLFRVRAHGHSGEGHSCALGVTMACRRGADFGCHVSGSGVGMEELQNTIRHQDCIPALQQLPAGSVDLVFADPPFNIGYEYDVYDDRKERDHYLAWC